MKFRTYRLIAIAAFFAGFLGSAQGLLAQNAYIPNAGSSTVSVINTVANKVVATIPVTTSSEPVPRMPVPV
jgi:YVTN family beta-propeller protein